MSKELEFRGPPIGWRDLFTLALPGTLDVLAPLLAGLYQSSRWQARYGPVAAEAHSRLYFLLSALLAGLFCLAVWQRLQRAHRRLRLQEKGLWLQSGRRTRLLPWDAIQHLLLHPTRRGLRASLHLSGGHRLFLPALEDLSAAVLAIQQHRATRLLPAWSRRLQRGERLTFGPLALSRRGLHYHAQTLPWRDLRQATIQHGALVIESSQSLSWRIPIQQVPDAHLILLWVKHKGWISHP